MNKRLVFHFFIFLILCYFTTYSFWHSFYGSKNLLIATKLEKQYQDKLALFKQSKTQELTMLNIIDCLNGENSNDLLDEYTKQMGLIVKNETSISKN